MRPMQKGMTAQASRPDPMKSIVLIRSRTVLFSGFGVGAGRYTSVKIAAEKALFGPIQLLNRF